jgi:D-isomer specific 2-hydroxyacid dehydrogenase, NAD binding domain
MKKTKTQITINDKLADIVSSVQQKYPIYDVNAAIEYLIARGSGDYLKDNQGVAPTKTKTNLTSKNTDEVAKLIDRKFSNDFFVNQSYPHKKIIVNQGVFVKDSNNDLDYANVPLGIIIKGSVIIHKDNKDTKKLEYGDFVGLFETADYLNTGRSRNIGDWTLTVEGGTEILYFTKKLFENSSKEVNDFKEYLLATARADYVPQPVSILPLLDWTAFHTTRSRLNDHVIIIHTHLLPNSVPLFRHLAHLVGVNRVYIVGKPYSTIRKAFLQLALAGIEVIPVSMKPGLPYSFSIKEAMEVLWHKVFEARKVNGFGKLLILDDGGDIWTSIPWDRVGDLKISGTEQTQRGVSRIVNTKLKLPPIICVATSGIKKEMESVFIAQSVTLKLKQNLELESKKIGVLGMGNIGHSIYSDLTSNGYECYYYDPINKDFGAVKYDSLDSLIDSVDIIVGATGLDVLNQLPFERMDGNKTLVSVSSADIEFASILNFGQNNSTDPFEKIEIQIHDNLNFTILNGGYPINFDRTVDSTPDDEIVLTRCLLYMGIMQAELLLREKNPKSGFYNLDPIAQHKLLAKWFTDVPAKAKQFDFETESQNIDKAVRADFLDTPSVWLD